MDFVYGADMPAYSSYRSCCQELKLSESNAAFINEKLSLGQLFLHILTYKMSNDIVSVYCS